MLQQVTLPHQPTELSVASVFCNAEYVIPIYQRNYAWGINEIVQLLDDIRDSDGKYYLGSLIVNQLGGNLFEVIDGQQRLTTLFLLLAYMKDSTIHKSSLRFEAREKSNRTLQDLLSSDTAPENASWYSDTILSGFDIIKNYCEKETGILEALRCRLEHIYIIRTQVPENIDLNHYFEIMNTRGEQLELHEIAKAKIISAIHSDDSDADRRDQQIAAEIWDACAQMDRYIPMSFPTELRKKLFGNHWDTFCYADYQAMQSAFTQDDTPQKHSYTLREVLKGCVPNQDDVPNQTDEENERFESILSFPNFLLQVSAILNKSDAEDDTGLDDKRLLKLMENHWKSRDNALCFLYSLLKYRFLFDTYIIKREFARTYKEDGRWSLQKLESAQDNSSSALRPVYKATYGDTPITENVRLLQSCLRTTYTSPKTMHWITEALALLAQDTNGEHLLDLLENYCRNKVKASDYTNRSGFGFERIVFTYLDYLLYRQDGQPKDYQFQFRTSIEHFYPQNPLNPTTEEFKALHHFGNLALITASANSRFSNLPPFAKVESFPEVIRQSPKLLRMEKLMKQNGNTWTEALAIQHGEEMFDLLKQDLTKSTQGIKTATH